MLPRHLNFSDEFEQLMSNFMKSIDCHSFQRHFTQFTKVNVHVDNWIFTIISFMKRAILIWICSIRTLTEYNYGWHLASPHSKSCISFRIVASLHAFAFNFQAICWRDDEFQLIRFDFLLIWSFFSISPFFIRSFLVSFFIKSPFICRFLSLFTRFVIGFVSEWLENVGYK